MAVPTDFIEDIIRRLLPDFTPEIPGIARNTLEVSRKGWARIGYVDALTGGPISFKDAPAVIVMGEVRSGAFPRPGEFVPPEVTLPAIAVPSITVPSIQLPDVPPISEFTIPRIERDDLKVTLREAFKQKARDALAGWTWWPASALRDAVVIFAGLVGAVGGIWFNWLFDVVVFNQLDKVQDAIQAKVMEILSSVETGLVDQRNKTQNAINTWKNRLQNILNTFRNNTQKAVNRFKSDAEIGLNKVTGFATTTLNKIVPLVWDQFGLEEAVLYTPLPYRNVGSTGFEVYVPGPSKIHYIAVGVKG